MPTVVGEFAIEPRARVTQAPMNSMSLQVPTLPGRSPAGSTVLFLSVSAAVLVGAGLVLLLRGNSDGRQLLPSAAPMTTLASRALPTAPYTRPMAPPAPVIAAAEAPAQVQAAPAATPTTKARPRPVRTGANVQATDIVRQSPF